MGSNFKNGYKDLKVYQLAYQLAMEIFWITKSFPPEERYSLTDQIRRSSRSVAANLAEAFRKIKYPKLYAHKLTDIDGETAETQVWLDLALDCGYLFAPKHQVLVSGYNEIGKMLGRMIQCVNLKLDSDL